MSDIALSPEQIKELAKCKKSPVYFVENFCWLEQKASAGVSEDSSTIQFAMGKNESEPFYFQRQILEWLHQRKNIVTLKSRRVGCSWVAAAYTAWLINFHKNVNVVMISRNGREAKKILAKVKFILKNLAYHDAEELRKATKADFLCGDIYNDNQELFTIGYRDERGRITILSEAASLTTTDDTARGDDSTLTIFDELAFYEHPDETWSAAKPAMTRGGQWMAISTPNGIGDVFHRLCAEGDLYEEGHGPKPNFEYRKIHWSEAGITEQQMRDSTTGMIDDLIEQEWEFKFITPGSTAFNPTHLAACYKPPSEYPEIARALENYRAKVERRLREPDAGIIEQYYTGVDSIVGKVQRKHTKKDYNNFTALTRDGIQAFAYHSKDPLGKWAGTIIDDGKGNKVHIPGIVSNLHEDWPGLCYIEEEGPGYTVVQMHQLPEDRFSEMRAVTMKHEMKRGIIERLILKVEAHQIVITDYFTYQCMMVYQSKGAGMYEAPAGYNDDPVMGLALASAALDRHGAMEFSFGQPLHEMQRGAFLEAPGQTPALGAGPRVQISIPEQYTRSTEMVSETLGARLIDKNTDPDDDMIFRQLMLNHLVGGKNG